MSNIGNVTFQKMIGGQKFILNQNPDGFVCTFTSVIFFHFTHFCSNKECASFMTSLQKALGCSL